LRWLLFVWVRVEVFPGDDPREVLDPARPVLYVLADRGLADLLVLGEAASRHRLPDPLSKLPLAEAGRHHSVYSIASRSPLIDWLKRRRKHSAMLEDILRAFRDHPSLELQIVPVSVFWGRPLARQKSWLQVLFSDTWSLAGRTRKFFTILIQGRNTRLIFSRAIELRELVDSSDVDAGELQELLISTLGQQREATFGPQIASHRQMTDRVLDDELVQELIAASDNEHLRRFRAHLYCREIFADCTQLTIEVMLRLLRAFWNRFYSGIGVYGIDRIREAALTRQLVYVPCHRSHVDYLLLSYVIYNENLALPYIAAGNNLDIPVIGRILRGGGAFFIRRSFKDNPLYTAVMRAYLYQLIGLGVPLEYFIEGGRSRTGRMLKPKIGMLGMTVEAYVKSQARPLAFVPVYIGYEKLIEGKAYLGELYGGKKKRESTLGALGAIFRLKGHFGKVTASFGEPIELDSLLGRYCADWRQRGGELGQRPPWFRACLQQLATQIMYGINRACVINPVNSIATIILATPRQSIEVEELIAQAELHHRLIRGSHCLGSIRIEGEVERPQIERIARQKIIRIRRHELGDIVYLEPRDTILIGYYRNNSLHSLVIPAMIACFFTNARSVSRGDLQRRIALLFPFLKSELQLEWQDASLEEIIDDCLACLAGESLLEKSDENFHRPRRSDHRFVQLMRLAHIVQPILERYYMTFIVLWQSTSAPLSVDELERRCYLLAQKVSMIYGIDSPDFFDRLLFRDFIDTMLANRYLVENDQGCFEFAEGFDYVSLDLRSLLSTEVRSSILSLIKATPRGS
jgi:glycerol-3-phosphate O-acyltransferase